jgi:hypothetical protein
VSKRNPLTFKKTDLVRAIKSVKEAGLTIVGIVITSEGDIEIFPKGGELEETEEDTWADIK